MKKLAVLAVMAVFLVCTIQVFGEGVGAALKIGTLGVGADVTLGLSKQLNTRVGVNMFSKDETFGDEDEADGSGSVMDSEFNFQTISALFDWHPGGGGFRLTAGAMVNNSEITFSVTPGENVLFNDNSYEVASVDGDVTFNDFAPYIGFGWGNAVCKTGRVTFAFDLGALFIGEPEVALSAQALNGSQQAQLDADIVKEKLEIEDDTDSFSIWPVLTLGLGFRF